MNPLVLSETQIRAGADLTPAAMQAVAEGFMQLSAGKVNLPAVLRIDFPEIQGEVDVKTAVVQGWNSFAIKVASGFLQNSSQGLPTGNGLMLLISALTGQPQAVLLDNGYLTDLRTALAGALAAQVLAPQNPIVGVVGSGMQARYQIRALQLVRSFQELHVYGIDAQSVNAYAQDMTKELGIPVTVHEHPRSLVEQCTLVVTTTPSRLPYLKASWLHSGLHITSMGADAPHKQELDAEVFQQLDIIACDARKQCAQLGELYHALQQGVLPNLSSVRELGELLAGRYPGRTTAGQITLCELTGVGVQDTAIARYVVDQVVQQSS
jgi:ornithine cyclodeaminase